ncbi:hypothetical protein ACTXT7_000127 [Hymenolepis weldensis]
MLVCEHTILELCQERSQSKPPAALVQRILKLTKRHPVLQDEVFCQLVKQTNRNESENPQVNQTDCPPVFI